MKAADPPCSDNSDLSALKRRRILFADSNSFFLDAACEFFDTCGHRTDRAADANDALNMVRECKTHYDVVVVDDLINDGNGLRLVQVLREGGYQGRIVIKAGTLSPAQRQDYRSLGAGAVIAIPVDFYELLRLVQTPPASIAPQ